MNFYNTLLLAITVGMLSACGGGGSSSSSANNNDTDNDGVIDDNDPIPTVYAFEDAVGDSTISYTGQTARHVLLDDLVTAMNALDRDLGNVPADVVTDLEFYYSLDPDTRDSSYIATFGLSDGENIIVNDTDAPIDMIVPGAISSGKTIIGKIAGNDNPEHILDAGGMIGWTGITSPEDLMTEFFRVLGDESTDATDTVGITGGTANIGTATVTESGLDVRQLAQKFLLGALTFSQGTADYLSIDYGSDANLTLASGKPYTEGAHDFDESFGYFGASRHYGELADSVTRNGYVFPDSDANNDSAIDLRSEYNFGNATNCAKRDQGSEGNTNPTDFTKEAFDAYLSGREILQNAATGATETTPGVLSAEDNDALDIQITIAAQTWEKCIAATVVHYINDVQSDLSNVDTVNNVFTDIGNFTDLAKHWSEMKGFALGLQFSPFSPFRANEVYVNGVAQATTVDINDLNTVLTLMGDAPVLADGTQDTTRDNIENGALYAGSATPADARAAYIADLITARDILQEAYGFDAENVENW